MEAVIRRRFRTKDAAAYIGIAPSTLEKMRLTGTGPIYQKAGPRIVVYDIQDIDAWLTKRRRVSTSDKGEDR